MAKPPVMGMIVLNSTLALMNYLVVVAKFLELVVIVE
jgi:hypothetical protein